MCTQKRHRKPAPAHLRFADDARNFEGLGLRERFERIYETNLWGSRESHSGTGSEIAQTARLRALLEDLVERREIRSILDIPCGDFAWMRHARLDAVSYTGADILPSLVERNRALYGSDSCRFEVLDLTADALPAVDLILCRDCLVHLSFAKIQAAIENVKRSGSAWLLSTSFPEHDANADIADGDWRLLNLQREPFCFPQPAELLNEGCTEEDGSYSDKSLGLWRIDSLP